MKSTLIAASLSFILMACFVGWVGWTLHQSEMRFKEWAQTTGTVISSTVAKKMDPSLSSGPNSLPKQTYWIIDVKYRYSIDNREYIGGRYSNSEELFTTNTASPPTQIQDVLNKYREGTQVPVFYAPQDPQKSYLELHLDSSWKFFLAAGISAVLGLFCLIILLKRIN